jgi:ClpP class serine protease
MAAQHSSVGGSSRMTAAHRPTQHNPTAGSAASGSSTPQKLEVVLGDAAPRRALIQQLQTLRRSRVIVYVTADRPDLAGQMNDDVVPIIYEHLHAMGRQNKVDLFLYTRGGHALTPQRLAYLFREFCATFAVLVPRFAHSAGTGLAISANEIVMHAMGELGPIDPTVANPFNPEDPTDPEKKRRIGIAVEDVTAYLALAKKQAGVPNENMGSVFEALSRNVHPLGVCPRNDIQTGL